MHILYQAALRWEMVERNPVVRQSSKRLKRPRVLTPAEFKALLAQLKEPYRTMVITVAWGSASPSWWRYSGGDLDTVSLTVQALRGFVRGGINPTKTEASESALPPDPDLADVLLAHKAKSVYTSDSDFVFAGCSGKR